MVNKIHPDGDAERLEWQQSPEAQLHKRRQTPLLTVDIIIEIQDFYPIEWRLNVDGNMNEVPRKRGIVLIERKNTPEGYALPGGFVDVGETTMQAAIREAKEETGLDITQVELLGVYDDPKRDPRGHNVSVAYIGKAIGIPKGADDAKNAFVVDPQKIGNYILEKLCFDHRNIITDYLVKRYGIA